MMRDDPILLIDRTGVTGFWSRTLWMMFLQETGGNYGDYGNNGHFFTLFLDAMDAKTPYEHVCQ
jgi:hypothetical protein